MAAGEELGKSELLPKTIAEELTPSHLRCNWGTCPSVFAVGDNRLAIIGKKPSPEILAELESKVGEDEYCIVINRELITNL